MSVAHQLYTASSQPTNLLNPKGKVLVDLEGFEPSTSSMPWKRAPNCATGPSEGQVGLE